MKQDRLNFTKLGNYEREEFEFRDKFKQKFNGALESLQRNDFRSLRETIKETEEQFSKQTLLAHPNKKETNQVAAKVAQKVQAMEQTKQKNRSESEKQAERTKKYLEKVLSLKQSAIKDLQEAEPVKQKPLMTFD